MFYCEKCQQERDWPISFSRSVGRCECCGEKAACFDVPSSALPTITDREYMIVDVTRPPTIDNLGHFGPMSKDEAEAFIARFTDDPLRRNSYGIIGPFDRST